MSKRIIHDAHHIELRSDSLRRRAIRYNQEYLTHDRPVGSQALARAAHEVLRAAHVECAGMARDVMLMHMRTHDDQVRRGIVGCEA